MIARRRVECHLEFTKLSTSSMRRVFDRTWVSLMLSSARTSLPFSTATNRIGVCKQPCRGRVCQLYGFLPILCRSSGLYACNYIKVYRFVVQIYAMIHHHGVSRRTRSNKIEQNRTKTNKIEENRTKSNKIEQNPTKLNKIEHSRTKSNEIKQMGGEITEKPLMALPQLKMGNV